MIRTPRKQGKNLTAVSRNCRRTYITVLCYPHSIPQNDHS